MSSHSLPPIVRPALRLFALAALFAAVPALHASSITYDITLSPSAGPYGGSGTITLASAPSDFGISTFSQANGTLQGLSFSVDNQAFSLAGYPSATVEFLDGKLYNISFAQTVGSSPNRFTLDTSGVYAFYYNNGFSESSGSITAIPDVAPPDTSDPSTTSTSTSTSPTPEPGSLLLLATALLLGGFFVLRRNRTAHS
jgi:hypothetical protein